MVNQYPLWKYLLILAVLVVGVVYALPNLYVQDPAVQISAARSGKAEPGLAQRVEEALKQGGLPYAGVEQDEQGLRVRFENTDTQLKARDALQRTLGRGYTVALNLLPSTPSWLHALNAKPMYLGLDLRGGVHFLMEVDMQAALRRAEERYVEEVRGLLQQGRVRYLSISRIPGGIEARFSQEAEQAKARKAIAKDFPELKLDEKTVGQEFAITAQLTETALKERRDLALEQNLTALRNRVDELGVAEPVIQRSGESRIVVQLPGVQDTARAKEILGRTATLEVMLVDDQHQAEALAGRAPAGTKVYRDRQGNPILLKKPVLYSGDNIIDAAAGFDQQRGGPVVHITLDARGADRNAQATRENVGKRMAVVYIETRSEIKRDAQGEPVLDERGEPVRVRERIEHVITAPVIQEPISKRFQISGLDSVEEARDLALLLRAGSLAAPIDIVEERTIGPSLGADNIERGFKSTLYGFAAIALFMMMYYRVTWGFIATLALTVNVVLLVAVLSIMQATLTLPGIAGIALTVGMAIDANVLIYERIREELRNGNTPQAAIYAGYERAWDTILDSNVTTLIAAIALFWLGSGPIRGFAVTLTIGILTSMFTAIMVSRAIVNLTYGRQRRLKTLKI